jgi:hypothetical protein
VRTALHSITSNDFPRGIHLASILHVFVLFSAIASMSTDAFGQAVEARAAGVSGKAVITRSARTVSPLRRGERLQPGDVVDTSGGGRVRIELSDGSIVIMQPGTKLILQDFTAAGTLRELLKVLVGRVRVRVNHFRLQPNPYRVNSPSASIGVRGTEFSVSVAAGGDTEVVVYEGLVEVTSLFDSQNRVMVGPGSGVIVRPNEPIRFFVPGPDKEIGQRGDGQDGRDNNELTSSGVGNEREDTASAVYERYIDSVVDSSESALPSRFAAFPDSHLDSLENPAFATEFSTPQGRLFLLPSFGRPRGKEDRQALGFGSSRLLDYSVSPQASYFAPLGHRTVVGGGFAFSRNDSQSFSVDESFGLSSPRNLTGVTGTRASVGLTDSRFFSGSVVASRRFGSDSRNSIGVGLDYLSQRGSLLNLIMESDGSGLMQREQTDSRSTVDRTRVAIGFARDVGAASKLGIYYRYGHISASDRNRSHTLDGVSAPLEMHETSARSSELGVRLRGPITRRLFYGVEGNFLLVNGSENIQNAGEVDSNEYSRSRRAVIGFGLGYILRRRTFLAFDVAGGLSSTRNMKREFSSGNMLEDELQRARFLSLHAAVQTDFWKHLFVSASILSLTQSRVNDLTLFGNPFERLAVTDGSTAPVGRSRDEFTDFFSNFGGGWRFTPNFLAQYVFSTDFSRTSARHTILLRYTFDFGGK